ncbi:MAG: G8 domain-containing protein, partial [Syntrophobacterales bacterium]|nr:G8 domain-containing protein [Syntrophobacterales bacterium]
MKIKGVPQGAFPFLKAVARSLMLMALLLCPLNTAALAEECIPLPPGTGADFEVTKPYCVAAGIYNYGFVNIHSGGKLIFADATIDFWAKSILVENRGSLLVGTPEKPIGTGNINNIVTFYLYGTDSKSGITCKLTNCGVPDKAWNNGGQDKVTMPTPDGTPEDKKVKDYFYKYENLPTYPADGKDIKDGD